MSHTPHVVCVNHKVVRRARTSILSLPLFLLSFRSPHDELVVDFVLAPFLHASLVLNPENEHRRNVIDQVASTCSMMRSSLKGLLSQPHMPGVSLKKVMKGTLSLDPHVSRSHLCGSLNHVLLLESVHVKASHHQKEGNKRAENGSL